MNELENIQINSVEDLQELRKTVGQSQKRMDAAAMEFSRTPESGTFSHIGVKKFTIEGVERNSIGLFLTDGGFIAESTLTKQNLLSEMQKVRNGKHAGKYILKSERLTNLSKFGNSLNAQMLKLIGKSFVTKRREDVRQYKQEYLDAEKFGQVTQPNDSDVSKNTILEKTEIGTGYAFEIQ